MTWLKIDDKLTTHPKWLALSCAAESVWLHASVWCAAHNNDGVIPADSIYLHTVKAAREGNDPDVVIAQLIKAGLWRKRAKRDGGGWEIANWLDYQPSKEQVRSKAESDEAKERRVRLHRWLHNNTYGKLVRARVEARDGHWCRYCGTLCVVGNKDQKGMHRRTFDLIDPTDIDVIEWSPARPLTQAEIVRYGDMWATACGYCNAVKGQRTPAEADMSLRSPGVSRSTLFRQDQTGSNRIRSRSDHEVGTVLTGSDLTAPASVPDPVRFGSDLYLVPPPSDDDYPHHDSPTIKENMQ